MVMDKPGKPEDPDHSKYDTNNPSDQKHPKRQEDDTNNPSDRNPQDTHSARDANRPWLHGYRDGANPKRDSTDPLDQNPEFQKRLSDLQAKQAQETRALFNKHNTENPVSWQLRKDREEIAALENTYKRESERLYDMLINAIAAHTQTHNKKDSDTYAYEAHKAYIDIQKRLQNQYISDKRNLEQRHYDKWTNIMGYFEKWKSLTYYEQVYLLEDAKDIFLPLQLEDQQKDLLQLSREHHEEIKALRSQYEND
jgi:hypothetical protein